MGIFFSQPKLPQISLSRFAVTLATKPLVCSKLRPHGSDHVKIRLDE